jgi:hypothetical protein
MTSGRGVLVMVVGLDGVLADVCEGEVGLCGLADACVLVLIFLQVAWHLVNQFAVLDLNVADFVIIEIDVLVEDEVRVVPLVLLEGDDHIDVRIVDDEIGVAATCLNFHGA